MKLKSIKEKRQFTTVNIPEADRPAYQLRAGENDQKERFLQGYAALYNSPSKIIGEFVKVDGQYDYREFVEVLLPKCFDQVLGSPDLNTIHTIDHNFEKMVSRNKSGTLKLESDDRGLKYTSLMPRNVSYCNDAYELVQRGDYTDSSFIFTVDDAGQRWANENGTLYRYILNVTGLYDVSTVVTGAYNFDTPQTQVMARSLPEEPVAVPEVKVVDEVKPEEPVATDNGEIDHEQTHLFILGID